MEKPLKHNTPSWGRDTMDGAGLPLNMFTPPEHTNENQGYRSFMKASSVLIINADHSDNIIYFGSSRFAVVDVAPLVFRFRQSY